ncbi:hypothetical protein FCH28_28850 [Streptomyces piniterrae]|uniref:Uncharacterized protein n=1 Tax=Streptomyces piniterrae TaxID=2571125 RepID=A0A4U0MW71_9ACTN|nr:hypothetical protein [Streptomyces piniterrae]TJZ45349.1 hypothetical protein FCH28_28850 [Streptomyces piniterrae]
MAPPDTAVPPSPSWRRWTGLGVPALVLLGFGASLLLVTAFASDTYQDGHYLGPSLRMHITAWTGLACGLAAPALYAALRRRAVRRGWSPDASRASGIALACLSLGLLALLFEAFGVWTLYAPDPAGGNDFSGLSHALAGAVPYPAG